MRSLSRRRGDRGVALVEFALIVPLLSFIALVTIDVGRAYFQWVQVRNAAREGASYARINPGSIQPIAGDNTCDDPKNIRYHARLATSASAADSNLTVSVTYPVGFTPPAASPNCFPNKTVTSTRPTKVTVTASKPFPLVTPMAKRLIGNVTTRAAVTVSVIP